jgi:polysaccharide pyruvyl transferase CsaB
LKRNIALLGYYGYDNLGDEAVLEGIIYALKQSASKRQESLNITVLSADPDTTRKRCDCNATGRKNFIDVLSALKGCDALVVGGGSLFQDATRMGLTPSYYAAVSYLAKVLGKKVYYYAQGIGPLKRSINRTLTSLSARMADILSVRDSASLFELRNLNVNAKSIHLTADPAFALLSDRDSLLLRETLEKMPNKPIMGVMLRNWPGIGDVLGEVAKACEMLAKELDLSIALVPMQKSQDLDVCRKLNDIMKTDSFIIEDDLPPAEMIALFERFSLVLAMRLHALIFAAIAGVPMLGIGYDPKINAFLAQMGMPMSSDTNSVSSALLAEQGIKLWNDREIIRERLLEKAKELRDEAFEFADTVVEALMGEK